MPRRYASCIVEKEAILPNRSGRSAPPAIDVMRSALAFALYAPMPSSASGQMVGQTRAFAKPRSATKRTVSGSAAKKVWFVPLRTIPSQKSIPRSAEARSAFGCERYLGMQKMPTM